jgi:hypothetical protein
VVGKNYRLQDIQLSKNGVGQLTTFAAITIAARAKARALQDRLRSRRKQTLVENTGLEPVTSWLQTRRSPS